MYFMSEPRQINPQKSFESIVSWIESNARDEHAPGAIVGISGTDSILTFLAAAKAYKNLNKPSRILGVHFGVQSQFNWVATSIIPWLEAQAEGARFEVTDLGDNNKNDHVRWGTLFGRAVDETDDNNSLSSSHYFPLGTRNATENYLGTYSQISKAVSLLPIIDFYKSEVLEICEHLGVPDIAMQKSCEIDCDCGRFDVAANHMQEVDWFIMKQKGAVSKEFFDQNVSQDVQAAVMEYVMEERSRNEFRNKTPYTPSQSLVVV